MLLLVAGVLCGGGVLLLMAHQSFWAVVMFLGVLVCAGIKWGKPDQ